MFRKSAILFVVMSVCVHVHADQPIHRPLESDPLLQLEQSNRGPDGHLAAGGMSHRPIETSAHCGF